MFIEFANSNDCQAAQLSLTGRKFSNRVVVTRSLFIFTPLLFYHLLSPPVTTTWRSITEGSFEQQDEEESAVADCGGRRRSVVSFSVASQHSARLELELLSFYITT